MNSKISLSELLEEVSYTKGNRTEDLLPSLVNHYTGNSFDDVKKRTKIYRGTNFNKAYGFVQPSKFDRKSANTYNFYTLIIDNSKHWSKYPKRGKSIICSTSEGKANGYGNIFQVVPKLNALVGICPTEDIWVSFKTGFELLNKIIGSYMPIKDLDNFNEFIYDAFNVTPRDNYETMAEKVNTKFFSNTDDIIKKNALQIQPLVKHPFKFIEYCLSPKLNGFVLMRYNNKFKVPFNREVWIGDDSLLINDESF